MPYVRLGHADGNVTNASVPDSYTDDEQFYAITHQDGANQGVWVSHSASRSPAWVESDNPDFAQKLAEYYGCPVGAPNSESALAGSGEAAS